MGMIRIKATLTCDYDISGNDEYKILKYMDEHGLNLKQTVEQLQEKGDIDILFKDPYNETVIEINKANFEEEESE